MIPNPYSGKFVIFDGADGCGKTTQIKMAFDWLVKLNANREIAMRPVKTKEPNKFGFYGKKIYEDLTNKDGVHLKNPFGFQAWYASDSRENLKTVILSELIRGNLILSDRFRSSMVFGVDTSKGPKNSRRQIDRLMSMNMAIIGRYFIWPDALIIFDVKPEQAMTRLAEKNIALDEFETHEKINRVNVAYMAFAEMYPNCYVVDANRSAEEVFEDVKKIILPLLK